MNNLIQFLARDPNLTNAVATVVSTFIAFMAFVVSVVSLYVGLRALRLQHRHNVLSVKPLPIVSYGDYEDRLTVAIHNNGPGPLIIKGVAVSNGSESKDSLIDWMPALGGVLCWDTFTGSVDHRSIPSGGEIILLQLSGDSEDAAFREARDSCRVVLGKLKVTADYTDIYESIMPPIERSLEWFGRRVQADSGI
jgi:hypothetical protein